MFDWLHWFASMENSKTVSLVLFLVTFCLIVLYVYGGKDRSERLESYKYIPLEDNDGSDSVGTHRGDRK